MLHHPLPKRGHARGANVFVAITEAMRENVSEDVVHVTFHQLDVFLRAFDLALQTLDHFAARLFLLQFDIHLVLFQIASLLQVIHHRNQTGNHL